jgi:hypothetical protein
MVNEKYLKRSEEKKNKGDIIAYIDKNVPQFSDKQVYDNGVVIYLV